MKINKKTVSHFLGLAVLFGAVELTHQLTKTEEQVTYSVTLESLALGNGETDGENGGDTGGGGSTDGESDGGTTGDSGGTSTTPTKYMTKSEITGHTKTTNGTCTIEFDFVSTLCFGVGTVDCTPSYLRKNCKELGICNAVTGNCNKGIPID